MLERKITHKILEWIKTEKKALLIDGARQVGKTTIIRDTLKSNEIDFVEFNLFNNANFAKFLESIDNISCENFIAGLSVHTQHKLRKNHTIIFIDEIQICKEVLTKVKFLIEEGSFKYIFSGSILGITLTSLESAPVGYLDVIKMYPLDFEEFLWSQKISKSVISTLKKHFETKTPVMETIHEKLMEMFYKYLIIGGMPEAVWNFCKNNNYNTVHSIHKQIVLMYKNDIAKYQNNDKKLKLISTYNLVPAELNKQNKRYTFNKLNVNFKFNRYEATFEWLNMAELTIPVYNVQSPEIPLLLNEKSTLFKLFLNDVGLLTSLYGVSTIRKILNNESNINYGALYENFVAQELHAHNYQGYYYKNKKYGALDFVIEYDSKILPIEVKSGKNYMTHCALNNIMSNRAYNIDDAFILSKANISQIETATLNFDSKDFDVKECYKTTYLPIYMTMFLDTDEYI